MEQHRRAGSKPDPVPAAKAITSAVPIDPDYSRVVTVSPRPWTGAKLGKCLTNVQEVIRREGGEACYGWALEHGPLRQQGWYPPPLYCRWLHHVVWRSPAGALWEVSPHLRFDRQESVCFLPTQFYADQTARFSGDSEEDWYSLPCQYLPLRPEGAEVARRLNLAQAAMTEADRNHWIRQALWGLADVGFIPREWKVETVGDRTGTIWLIAE